MLFNKPLNQITEADLQSLITNQVREGTTVEYKENVQAAKESEKKEFLADVSCFANAAGGNLLIGIKEQGGIATEIRGCALPDVNAEMRRLGSIIQAGLY